MDFGEALRAIRAGKRVGSMATPERSLYLVPGSTFVIQPDRPMGKALPHRAGESVDYDPHIDCYDEATNTAAVWWPTQEDILADDWEVRD
jgi:hypothetical protein